MNAIITFSTSPSSTIITTTTMTYLQEGWEDAPIMVWLDGGPGISSMFSLFNIHGPFSVNVNGELVPREYSSMEFLNIAFVDNPVFSGE